MAANAPGREVHDVAIRSDASIARDDDGIDANTFTAMPNRNDDASKGDAPPIAIHDRSLSRSTDVEARDVKKSDISTALLPVPLTMGELQLRGLGLETSDASGPIADGKRAAAYFALHSRARSTLKVYDHWWRVVVRMAEDWGVHPLPMDSDSAAIILADMIRHYEWKSIANARNSIRMAHRLARLPDPTWSPVVDDVMRGIAKKLGTEPKHQKLAILADHLRLLARAAACRPWPRGIQEWAMMAVGYFYGLRRSEIVELDIEQLLIDAEGMEVFILRSKTDQFGRGDGLWVKRLPDDPELCPVKAVEDWRRVLGESTGPQFRRIYPGGYLGGRLCAATVTRTAQRYADVMELPVSGIGGHSLRAGCATQLKLQGVEDVVVAAHTRHRNLDMVAAYFRPRDRGVNYAKLLSDETKESERSKS